MPLYILLIINENQESKNMILLLLLTERQKKEDKVIRHFVNAAKNIPLANAKKLHTVLLLFLV